MKFCGKVGYMTTIETSPGVWTQEIIEKIYRGDIIRNNSKWQKGEGINDDIQITTDISIIADAFAVQHFSEILYVEFMGAPWKVSTATPERPRITLSLGGLYNGERPVSTADDSGDITG